MKAQELMDLYTEPQLTHAPLLGDVYTLNDFSHKVPEKYPPLLARTNSSYTSIQSFKLRNIAFRAEKDNIVAIIISNTIATTNNMVPKVAPKTKATRNIPIHIHMFRSPLVLEWELESFSIEVNNDRP